VPARVAGASPAQPRGQDRRHSRPLQEQFQVSAKRSQSWSLLPTVVEHDPDHDHRAGSDYHRADQLPLFEHSDNGCPPDRDSLRMRQAPSRHTHSETPFGPQQRRLDSSNAKRSPAIANSGATTESWPRVVKKPQHFRLRPIPGEASIAGSFVRHNPERVNTAGRGWGSLTN